MTHAWALISIAEERQYGGNIGYEDDPRRLYRFDSFVPNHKRIQAGDLIFIRDRHDVLGVACIEEVVQEAGKKIQNRCPICTTSRIKKRKQKRPAYRCTSGHVFDSPLMDRVDVTVYEARYENSFFPFEGQVSVSDLRTAAVRPNDQLSMHELDLPSLEHIFTGGSVELSELLELHLQTKRPTSFDADRIDSKSGPQDETCTFALTFTDTRDRIVQSIVRRRGQKSFRDRLIRRYGPACMVSGCSHLDVVEAAHIWPYRGADANHPENGLLLRADLHTLFDLDLMSFHPDDLTVHFHPVANRAGYERFAARQLQLCAGRRPSRAALLSRWNSFQQCLRTWQRSDIS